MILVAYCHGLCVAELVSLEWSQVDFDRGWALANQPAVARWTAALRHAVNFIAADPSAARAILDKYAKLQPPVVGHLPLPHFDTKLQKSDLDAWIKFLTDPGEIQGPRNADTMLATAH